MQQLVQQHQVPLNNVSSRWASFEAKIITLVNSCLLAPAGQVRPLLFVDGSAPVFFANSATLASVWDCSYDLQQ